MTDAHDRDVARVVADALAERALTGPAFDHGEIAADYNARIEMDASLDALIGPGDAERPAEFDPREPR